MDKIFVKKPKSGKALFFEVPSKTTPGQNYTIRVMPDGDVRCGCIANTMNHICLHIRYFQKNYNEDQEKLTKDIKPEDLIEYQKELEPVKEDKKPEKVDTPIKKPSTFASDFPF